MRSGLSLSDLVDITGGALGRHDVACPLCGPSRRSPANQQRKVLRIWCEEGEFATFKCARCGAKGYAADRAVEGADQEALDRARSKAIDRQHAEAVQSLRKARWLWSRRKPVVGSIAEKYLRHCRGYTGDLPGTLGYLPGRDRYPPAMIAAFGMALETLPSQITIQDAAVRGVHITRLKSDGSGKAGTEADKLTIGQANTAPIWLAPVNEGLGLSICEGIEDSLSVHAATGLGAWAAGAAGRLPGMADHIPTYVETVSVIVDGDPVGERNAKELANRLDAKGLEVLLVRLGART
jgi:hypothetical protein